VLIDKRQSRWILVTALLALISLAVYFWLSHSGPMTGGSTAGLWYGSLGSALMIYAALLSALRKVPTWWWIGSRKTWLKGHIWLGLLSFVLILCHSGFHWGGPLEKLLWGVFGLTIALGIFGVALQQFLPRLITARVDSETPYEQIPHVCEELRKRANAMVEKIVARDVEASVGDMMSTEFGLTAHIRFLEFYGKEVQPFLSEKFPPNCLMADAMRAESKFSYFRLLPAFTEVAKELTDLENICDERRQMHDQEGLHHWLHGWLLLHIPLSILLLVLGAAHAVIALYY
jgi:hypothetical protein